MVSSNSSAEGVKELLAESLEVLAREAPIASRRLATRLRELPVALTIDREALTVVSDGARVRLAGPGEAAITLATSRATIAAVIDGELPLRDAIIGDRIALRGPLDQLLVGHASLQDYVHGAVRCPSFPPLLQRFRTLLGDTP